MLKLKIKLLEYVDVIDDKMAEQEKIECVEYNEKNDCLTENTLRDGNDYFIYIDEVREAMINISTGEIESDPEVIESLLC